jgi:antibiotic biosynthesis monooxygenase (ABM) superfamily enzyme
MTIKRIWNGWTTLENADAYQRVLLERVIPGIEAKRIPGYRGMEVLRRTVGDEVEFTTLIEFDSLNDVIGLQGPDYERAYVPDVAQAVLKRWDEVARHAEVVRPLSSATESA